jgi:hypothetical protein
MPDLISVNEWTTIDKSDWDPGPWQDEPDKIHWVDPATDLDCLMVRGPVGAWCGYVAVTEDHPWFNVGYSSCTIDCDDDYCYKHAPEGQIEVHGGLTYSNFCQETNDPAEGICHVPLPGRPDRVWWFGFDCAHAGDLGPQTEKFFRERGISGMLGNVYRDRQYVEQEVLNLARQLAAVLATK